MAQCTEKAASGAPHTVLLRYPDLINSNIYKSQGGGGSPIQACGSVMDPQDPEFFVLHFSCGNQSDPYGSHLGSADGS